MHRVRLLSALLFAVALLVAPAARSASSDMVVSQVYGGGGNSGATYANDFVELFNRGAAAVDLGTWSDPVRLRNRHELAGDTAHRERSAREVLPRATRLRRRRRGAHSRQPDATGTTNLANSGGKVAVVRSTTALTCGGLGRQLLRPIRTSSTSSATARRRTTRAPTRRPPSRNTTADARGAGGCTDTDANDSDFTGATPTPRNSAALNCFVRGRTAAGGIGVGERRRRTSTSRVPSRSLSRSRTSASGAHSRARARPRSPSALPSRAPTRPAMRSPFIARPSSRPTFLSA